MVMYATQTTVPVEKSKAEIEKLAMKYGASGFSTAWKEKQARVEFLIGGRHVRIEICLPDKNEERFSTTDTGRKRRNAEATYRAWEQECRSIWRALKAIVHAKFEAVECGVSTYDQEFMANIMLPDGKTVGEHALPTIKSVYDGGKVKGLLPGF